ncbi:MAG: c-type cytochrome [Nitrospinales bacterium]
MKKILTLLFILLIARASSAYMGYKGYSELPEPLPTSEGELIFQESGCVLCHGIQGDGDGFLASGLDPKPRNFTSYEEMQNLPDLQMAEAIKNGIPGTAMPSHNFTDHQIEELIVYLRSLLAESYLTINMCITDEYIIDSKKENGQFRVEADNPDLIQVKTEGKYIHVTAKSLRPFLTSNKKVTRTHIKVIEKDDSVSLITVRLHRCMR